MTSTPFTTVQRVREMAGTFISSLDDAEITSHIEGAEAEVSARTGRSDWDPSRPGEEIVNDTTAAIAGIRAIIAAAGGRLDTTFSYTLGNRMLQIDRQEEAGHIKLMVRNLQAIADTGIKILRKMSNARKIASSTNT